MVRPSSSLLGREDELHQVARAIAAERPVAVVGEAGIGKTSLIRAAAESIGVAFHEGGGFATLADIPFVALERATGFPLGGDVTGIAATVERRVGPDLLFIDDLQWVDRGTLAALELLTGRVGLAIAIRAGDPRRDRATELVGRLGFEIVELRGVDDATARAIVRRIAPELADYAVERIVRRAGGNPLMLEEMAAHGDPSPVLARAIEAGMNRLSVAGREMIELLAVADCPLDRGRLGSSVEEPMAAGYVRERHGQVEIRHAVLAEAIRARITGPERAALHERVADRVEDPVESARHLALAGLPDRAAAVAEAGLLVVDDPVKRSALLVLIANAANPRDELAARLRAGRALADVSDWEALLDVLPDDRLGGSPDELAERDLLRAHAAFSLGRHTQARAHLDRVRLHPIEPSGPIAGRVAIEAAAFMVNVDGELAPAIELLGTHLTRYTPDDPTFHAIRAIRESMRMLAAEEIDIDYLRGTIDGALAAQAFATAADLARVVSFATLIWLGAEPALRFLADMGVRFERVGASGVAREFEAEAVQANILAGHPAAAVTRADDLLEQPAGPRARQTATIFRARALGILGRLDEAEASLAQLEPSVTDDFVGRGELKAALADLALWGGTPDRAIALVGEVLTIPPPIHGAYALPGITRAWAQFELGNVPAPVGGIAPTRIMAGAMPELRGLDLLARGDAVAASLEFAEGTQMWAGFNAPRALVCQWAEAEALRRAGRVEAIERLDQAHVAAVAAGFEPLAARVRRSMRQAGIRITTSDRSSRMVGIQLTARERELMSLVGRGLTNIEIARRMALGRPTVTRILSNAMSKIGAESRAQAVAQARDLD